MGIKAISLPDELIMELELAAEKGSRGFSAEVRMRIERDRLRGALADPSLGLDGVAATKEISGPSTSEVTVVREDSGKNEGRILRTSTVEEMSDEASVGEASEVLPGTPEMEAGAKKAWEKKPFKSMMKDEVFGKKEKAKKIAIGIPGVKVASEVDLPIKPGTHPMDEVTKSAKKRPKDTGERFELIKGFYRETFDSIGDAMAEIDVRGWKPDEYQLKPIE